MEPRRREMLRLIVPRFAMVQWPDRPDDPPCCITLDAVESAVRRGALLLGREDAILEEPVAFNPPRLATDHEGDVTD